MRRVGSLIIVLALALTGCSAKPIENPPAELVVSAAASLQDALKEIQTAYETEHSSIKLRFNFGSSGALQQQIAQGAPADLFISAATGPMEQLVKAGLVEQSAVQTLVTNSVVLIRSADGPGVVRDWGDLTSDGVQRIAIGNPQHVPAGQYGQAVLESLDLWAGVEPRLILGEDVRQVLHYVASGEVQAGIVYGTDAATSSKVTVIATAPAGSHAPIRYPIAVVKGSKQATQAEHFTKYLLSEKGQQVLSKYGFGPAQ